MSPRNSPHSAPFVTPPDSKRHLATGHLSERLIHVTSAIASAVIPEDVYEAVVDETARALEASSAALWRVSEERTTALVRSIGYSEAHVRAFATLPLDRPGRLPTADAILSEQPVWIDSQAELLERYPHLEAAITAGRSYRISALPLVVDGHVIGVLGFTFEDAPPFEDDDRAMLQVVARYSAQALERLRMLDTERAMRAATEAAAARTEVLSRASRAFSEAGHDYPGLLQTVAEQVASTHADACGMLLIGKDGETLEPAAMHHREPEITTLIRNLLGASPARLQTSVSGEVIRTGKSVLIEDIDLDEARSRVRPEYREWLERYQPRSCVVVPLRARGRIIGTLTALRSAGLPSFSEADQQMFEELGERAAVAIETSQLYRENEQARLRAELLYRMAEAVIRADSVERVYDAALDALERALGTNRSAILVFDDDGVMRFKAWRNLSDNYRLAVEGHTPWSRDAKDPEAILVQDALGDPTLSEYRELFTSEQIGSLGFIPLCASGRLLGKCMVYFPEPRQLTSAEVDMASAIANHVASAIARFSAVAELERTVRFNEMFAAILGHDLRNPLGAITTAAQLIALRAESDKIAKPASRILSSGSRMANMIDQLLDFTRVRVGAGIPIHRRRTDLIKLIHQVIEELEVSHPQRVLRLEHEAPVALGHWDEDRLLQVFSNLIANAIQHGDDRHPVRIRVSDDTPRVFRVDIQSAGRIPEELLPSLFEPLSGGPHRRNGSNGLGLGLYITRQILEAHGGRITVRSTAEEDTIFSVFLPAGAEAA